MSVQFCDNKLELAVRKLLETIQRESRIDLLAS